MTTPPKLEPSAASLTGFTGLFGVNGNGAARMLRFSEGR